MADDDLWHVRIAADEVKILSLEKLDDLFRLDVIDADVLVWQPGMDEWLPLRVVAGIGDDAPEVVNIAVSEPPPRPSATTTSWPPQAVARPTSSAWPPQVGSAPPRSVAPAPRSLAPLPPVSRPPASLAPQTVSHSASSWPPPAAWADPAPSPFAPTVSAAQFPLYAKVAPLAAVDTDVRIRRRGGGTWLVLVALAAGAVVTVYRNAMVHAAAKSMGQETAYLNLETALGGPSFGTPRAVEKMTDSSRALLASLAQSAPAATAAAAGLAASPPSPSPSPSPAPEKAPESQAAAADKPAPAPQQATRSGAAGPTRPVSAPAPAPRAAAAREPDPVFKTPKGKKGKGNEFDPLNPNL